MNRKIWSIVLTASAAIFALLWATLPEKGGSPLDNSIVPLMEGLRGETMTAVMKAISGIGSTAGLVVATLLAAVLIGWQINWRQSLLLIGAMAVGYGLNTAVKHMVDRARPDEAWGIVADGASFPSANAMLGFVLFGMVAVLVASRPELRNSFRGFNLAVCIIMIILLGASRLYFQVHYLSDILAGYSAGLAIIAAANLLPGGGGSRQTRKGSYR